MLFLCVQGIFHNGLVYNDAVNDACVTKSLHRPVECNPIIDFPHFLLDFILLKRDKVILKDVYDRNPLGAFLKAASFKNIGSIHFSFKIFANLQQINHFIKFLN